MKTTPFLVASLALAATATANENDDPKRDDLKAWAPEFEAPVALEAGGAPIATEAPGYASPAWHDVNGDGKGDLVVGQFADGKMMVYHGQGNAKFAKGEWLKAAGEVAEVPGVW